MTAFVSPATAEGVKANWLKKHLGLLLADSAVMIVDKQRVLSQSRAHNRWYHNYIAGLMGRDGPDWQGERTAADAGEDDMIHVGDIYQNIQVPGQEPTAVAAGTAAVNMKATTNATPSSTSSKLRNLIAIGCLASSLLAGPGAIAELGAILSGAAEIKVLWDGQEIKPGESASASQQ